MIRRFVAYTEMPVPKEPEPDFPTVPILNVEQWVKYIMHITRYGDIPYQIDFPTTRSLGYIFDGMVRSPMTRSVDGKTGELQTIVMSAFLYDTIADIEELVKKIHDAGEQTFLLGVQTAEKKVLMSCPTGFV